MKKVHVNASRSYDIFIGGGLLDKSGEYISAAIKARHVCVVTDDNVDPLYSERLMKSLVESGFSAEKYVFPHGEASKCHATLLGLYDFLAEKGFPRSDALIALGGGVVGDLTGFAAATYMRGIGFVQIPTTVLAQTDSSVGGKTAVDIAGGKNLVGAFYQPQLVLCDIDALHSLTPEFFADGMAEVVKYGMIKSRELSTFSSKRTSAIILRILSPAAFPSKLRWSKTTSAKRARECFLTSVIRSVTLSKSTTTTPALPTGMP